MVKGQENLEWERANGHWCLLHIMINTDGEGTGKSWMGKGQWSLMSATIRVNLNYTLSLKRTWLMPCIVQSVNSFQPHTHCIALLVKQGTFPVYKHKKIAAFKPFDDTCMWKDSQAYELFRIRIRGQGYLPFTLLAHHDRARKIQKVALLCTS